MGNKSVLFFHVYLKGNWREVVEHLLQTVPQDDLVVHLCFDLRYIHQVPLAFLKLKVQKKRPIRIYFSENKGGLGEVLGLKKMLERTDLSQYAVLSYIHSKGVTKPDSKPVRDWRELMRYYIMDRMDIMWKVFRDGFDLYGTNLTRFEETGENEPNYAFKFSPFIYRGNFVSVNLTTLREKIKRTSIDKDYYGVEGFWGKLSNIEKAYCAHKSNLSHYTSEYPEHLYKE